MKIVILGNCGCGKTYLADKLADIFNIPVCNLDRVIWQPGTDLFRDNANINKDLDNFIIQDNYIIEGVWGNAIEYILNKDIQNINMFIFIEINLEECKYNILKLYIE